MNGFKFISLLFKFSNINFMLSVILAITFILLHLVLLHENGSNNPLGIYIKMENIPFYPYFYVKDLFGFIVLMLIFSIFIYYYPNTLGHPDNYIPANPMKTPLHIVPEWYFLPFYAILRSIANKLQGVILMFVAIFVLVLVPLVLNNLRQTNFVPLSGLFRPFYEKMVQVFFCSAIILGWIGGNPAESPYILLV